MTADVWTVTGKVLMTLPQLDAINTAQLPPAPAVSVWVHPGQVAGPLQATDTHTHKHTSLTHAHVQAFSKKSNCCACFWSVGGKWCRESIERTSKAHWRARAPLETLQQPCSSVLFCPDQLRGGEWQPSGCWETKAMSVWRRLREVGFKK